MRMNPVESHDRYQRRSPRGIEDGPQVDHGLLIGVAQIRAAPRTGMALADIGLQAARAPIHISSTSGRRSVPLVKKQGVPPLSADARRRVDLSPANSSKNG